MEASLVDYFGKVVQPQLNSSLIRGVKAVELVIIDKEFDADFFGMDFFLK
jgi:hypothetical protein